MKLCIFAVRDRATVQFGNPMFMVNSGQAIRSFSDEINKKEANNMLSAHPGDFDLYELGTYDTDSGVFECHVPRQVAVGKDLVIKE